MIPDGQRGHLFLKKGNVLFLRTMVRMMRAVGALLQTEHSKLDRDKRRCTELHHAGFPILYGMADSLLASREMQPAEGRPDDYREMKFVEPYNFLL